MPCRAVQRHLRYPQGPLSDARALSLRAAPPLCASPCATSRGHRGWRSLPRPWLRPAVFAALLVEAVVPDASGPIACRARARKPCNASAPVATRLRSDADGALFNAADVNDDAGSAPGLMEPRCRRGSTRMLQATAFDRDSASSSIVPISPIVASRRLRGKQPPPAVCVALSRDDDGDNDDVAACQFSAAGAAASTSATMPAVAAAVLADSSAASAFRVPSALPDAAADRRDVVGQ